MRALNLFQFRILLLVLTLVSALGVLFAVQPAQATIDRESRARALKATVLIVVPDNSGQAMASGSGTIIDADNGYILSNYHVVGDIERQRYFNKDGIVVIGLMPNDLKGAPVMKYLAQVVAADPNLDLSLLKIVSLFDNQRAPLPQNLGLTEIPRGNFDDMAIGDDIAIFGYPGIGGSTVTFTEGKLSGFLDEDQSGDYEWAKTDASASHGNSGGLATNDKGEFIGVPTQVASEQDTAANLTKIRNGNLALQFVDRALMRVDGGGGNQQRAIPKANVRGSAQLTSVEFGAAVNRDGVITRPTVRFASGTTDIYASFKYDNFEDGGTFAYTWYQDGKELTGDSLEWGEGRTGSNWVNLNNDRGLDDGFYELAISFNGVSLFRNGVAIGKAVGGGSARFGRITFAENSTADGKPVNQAQVFANVPAVYAFFDVVGMTDGMVWTSKWYYEGEEVAGEENVWEFADISSHHIWLEHPEGLPAGKFKLELYIEGKLQQSGEFEIGDRTRRQSRNTVAVAGTIADQDNRQRPIAGALVVFLNPGISVAQWADQNYDESLIFAQGVTGRDGSYQLDKKVERGGVYSVVVYHEKYQLVSEDDYLVPEGSDDPYMLDATMSQN